MKHVTQKKGLGWLLFFYSAPSKPVSNRMKIWRKLIGAGAVQMKGAVYMLPFSDDNYEFFQWLVSEVAGMKGDAAFVRIERVETIRDSELIALFNRQRANDYKVIGKACEDIEIKLNSIRKGGKPQNIKGMSDQFAGLRKDFEEIRKIDFFSSKEGVSLSERIRRIHADIKIVSGTETKKEKTVALTLKSPNDYQGKTWITRKRPFIDRMASAWLIKRFIDKNAAFDFVDEKDAETAGENAVTFDVRGGEFTHVGDMCTFEVLVRVFGLKDKALKKIAEIVHDLDMKDKKYGAVEAEGIEEILSGIRKTAKSDTETLEKGMAVFEMLYVSKT